MSKICEMCCYKNVVRGNRYCKQCGKKVLAELGKAGFLEPRKYNRRPNREEDEDEDASFWLCVQVHQRSSTLTKMQRRNL